MKRFRYVMPTRKGRWLPTKEAAQDAAAKAGFGSRSDYDDPDGPRRATFFADPLLQIEEKTIDPARTRRARPV
ncbi:hypothetical protein [Sphingobium chungbukense]|uniref:Uncharacterized protein n=1 Tax=Sphingobium chungbukense TaxID=56193 RepID=A0A0M3AVK1_9SPHN|nr:hypothetical protein [Sphingobium chungbukense]KKW93855.1 hypothetical protein YP76_04135 [Sphingobium chungbukense]